MGLVTSALQIGRSALLAYQNAIYVTGSNIANAGSNTYARRTPILTPLPSVGMVPGYSTGLGVQLGSLRRNVDEALENRLRTAISDERSALTEQYTLGRVESLFNELSEYDLSSQLNEFFNAWSDVQNTPQDISTRGIVLTVGASLAGSMHRMRNDLVQTHKELNEQITGTTGEINRLLGEIADLNRQVVAAEAGGGTANSLRDQRDGALKELSELVSIQIRQQEDGSVNVYAGNDLLVQAAMTRRVRVETKMVDGLATSQVRFEDDHSLLDARGGTLEGILNSRQQHVLTPMASLNQLTAALIQDVNRVHAEGQGLVGLTDVTGEYAVLDPALALNASGAGLDLIPQNGSFLITVTDDAGHSIVTQIDVDLDGVGPDRTLNDVAAALDAVDHISASVTADGRLSITADPGASFTFSQDSSHVLAALGINTFFSGSDASDISINPLLANSPERLAVATENLEGDGSNAGRIAALANEISATLGGSQSLMDFYNGIVGAVAVSGQAALNAVAAAGIISGALEAQHESTSGVNLDEEAVQLMKFEKAYQGAARYVSVVDELINELIGLIR